MAKYVKINSVNPEVDLIEECANCIKKGGSIVYPTETLYGLGVDIFNEDACKRVFNIKERDSSKPLIVHISNIDDVYKIAVDVPDVAIELMNHYWPGALTIVLKKSDKISDVVSHNNTVGVRMPNNKIELEIIKTAGVPITGTSANLSGSVGIIDPRVALEEIGNRVDMVIDGGVCDIGVPSTIIDLSSGSIKLVREGAIIFDEILKFLEINDNKKFIS